MFIETSAKAGFNIKARRAGAFHAVFVDAQEGLRLPLSSFLTSHIPLPLQALFRKIASALPGMESLDSGKQEVCGFGRGCQLPLHPCSTRSPITRASPPNAAFCTCAGPGRREIEPFGRSSTFIFLVLVLMTPTCGKRSPGTGAAPCLASLRRGSSVLASLSNHRAPPPQAPEYIGSFAGLDAGRAGVGLGPGSPRRR